jgi:hypothetical protein
MTTEEKRQYMILRDELHDYCIVNEMRERGCIGCLLENEPACSDVQPRLSTIKKAVELIRKERAANACI